MNKHKELDFLKENINLFLSYLKERYPVHVNSNIFLRDIQYGLKSFFEKRDTKLNQKEVEHLSDYVISVLENTGIILKLSSNTWRVNYFTQPNVILENSNK